MPDEFSLKVTGTIVAPEDGEWTFTLVQVGRARFTIDGQVVVDNWNPTGRSDAFMGFGSGEASGTIELRAGEPHTIEVEFIAPRGLGGLEIGCRPPAPPDLMDRAVALAARADAVVCVVGTDNDWETEGHDRESMALPPPQDELDTRRRGRELTHRRGGERGVADRDAVGRRRRRDRAGVVPGRRVGQRARRHRVGRRFTVGQAADDVPCAHRRHARVHELSRRAGPGALRRRRVRRLPLVRHA